VSHSIHAKQISIGELNFRCGANGAQPAVPLESVTRNEVEFIGFNDVYTIVSLITGGQFTLKDYYVTPGKSHLLVIGSVYPMNHNKNGNGGTFTFGIDHKSSAEGRKWFWAHVDNAIVPDDDMGNVNFCLLGDLQLSWSDNYAVERSYVFEDVVLTQYYKNLRNYWNFGGRNMDLLGGRTIVDKQEGHLGFTRWPGEFLPNTNTFTATYY
jgi:hypothetical protein